MHEKRKPAGANGGLAHDNSIYVADSSLALEAARHKTLLGGGVGKASRGSAKPESVKHGPFEVTDEGVFYLDRTEDGETERSRVAARVDVLAQTRDSGSKNWGRLLRWKDNDGQQHQWAMPMESLASDTASVRARLQSEGLPFISMRTRHRERFTEYLQTAPADRRARSVARTGWYGDAYVLPDEVIGSDGEEELIYQTPHETEHHWRVSGSLEEWGDDIGWKCSGNSRLILAVSCAFAGPLLSLMGAESGGLHLHGATSTGKSTALVVGGSVCGGGGQAGFVQTWRATLNGLEAVAEAHNDGTLFLDELAQVDPREAAETAYLFANGQGKGRMTKTLEAARKLSWRLMFLSSGEMTLAEHSAAAGRRTRGGAEVRLLNVEADAGKGMGIFEDLHGLDTPDAFADTLKAQALRHFGSPFRVFLGILTADLGEAKRFVREIQGQFADLHVPPDATGEVIRAANRFSLIAAAGELATEYELTGWQTGEAIEAASRCFAEWLQQRGTGGSSDAEAGVRQVRHFIEVNGASRFQSVDSQNERIVNRAGYKRNNLSGETEYLILPETFKREVCAGFDYRMVARALEERGYLHSQRPNLTKKTRLPELGNVRVFSVRAGILG